MWPRGSQEEPHERQKLFLPAWQGAGSGTAAKDRRVQATASTGAGTAGSPGCPEQWPQQAGQGAEPQGPWAARQAHGCAAVTLAALAAGDGEGAAVRGHGAVGTHRGAGLHDQDAAGVCCGERREGPWLACSGYPPPPSQPAAGQTSSPGPSAPPARPPPGPPSAVPAGRGSPVQAPQ